MPTKKLIHQVGLSILICLSPIAMADKLEEVVITALRKPVSAEDFIGNYSYLNSEQLEVMGVTHIQEALTRLPGVNLHRNSGQEYLPAIRSPVLSGSGACGSFLMAEDGIPLLPAGFCNVNELFAAHTEQASRIEVVRGPSSALYGSNAQHGVINVITPQPAADKNQLSVEAGTLDFYRTKLKTGTDKVALLFAGTKDQGFRDSYGVDQQKLTVKYHEQLSDVDVTSGLTMINLNQETAGYIVGTDSYKDKNLVEENLNPEAYRDAQSVRLWTRLEREEGNHSWVVTPYARYSTMTFLQHFLPGTPLEENGQHSLGFQSAYYVASGKSQFIVGLDGEWVDGWLKQSQEDPTPGSAFVQETIPVGYHYDYDVTATQLAPFIHWQYVLAQDWDLTLAMRYEWMQYDYDNRMLDGRTRDDGSACGFSGCRYSRPPDSKDSFSNFSPKLGLSYNVAEGQRVYMILASGFRAPQAVELYRLQREQQVADLKSEQLNSVEFGYQLNSGDLHVETQLYAMQKKNVIYRDSDFFNQDSGRTKHVGLEVSLGYQLSPSLSTRLVATEARHTYDFDDVASGIDKGNDVDGAPHHFGSWSLNWTPTEAVVLDIEWQHMGSYFTDPENEHRYRGHDVLNLRGQMLLAPNLELSARLINATDRRYADRADYTTFSGDRYFPGTPRALFLGLSFNW